MKIDELKIESDAQEWCEALMVSDPWLGRHVRNYLLGGAWTKAIAIGMLNRLAAPPDEEVNRSLATIMRGEAVTPLESREVEWARGLDSTTASTLESYAMTAAHLMSHDAEHMLAEDADPCSVVAWLRDRDDLEGVAWLLETRGPTRLRDVLADIDEQFKGDADRLRRQVLKPDEKSLDDERLRRAGQVDPEAWWTQVAFEVEEVTEK